MPPHLPHPRLTRLGEPADGSLETRHRGCRIETRPDRLTGEGPGRAFRSFGALGGMRYTTVADPGEGGVDLYAVLPIG